MEIMKAQAAILRMSTLTETQMREGQIGLHLAIK